MRATARTEALPAVRGIPRLREVDRPTGSRRGHQRSRASVLLSACRPRQWFKNVLVAVAPATAGVLTRPDAALRVAGAFGAFCLLSSATYLLNDVRDRDQDQHHPRKRTRPIAAGELSPTAALRVSASLALLGLAVSFVVRPAMLPVALCYLTLTTSYSIWWRRVVVADIVVIAGGFLLRAVAGAVAADVSMSRAFLAVTSACALFLVAGKRHAEVSDGRLGLATRATLHRYSARLLRCLLAASGISGCLAYALWAFSRSEHGPWLELSMIPFALWLGRYAVMLAAGAGEAPEELITRDRALLVLALAWVWLFATGVYVAT